MRAEVRAQRGRRAEPAAVRDRVDAEVGALEQPLASATRRPISHCSGVVPVSATKRRANERGE